MHNKDGKAVVKVACNEVLADSLGMLGLHANGIATRWSFCHDT